MPKLVCRYSIIPAKQIVWVPLLLQAHKLRKLASGIPSSRSFVTVRIVNIWRQAIVATCCSKILSRLLHKRIDWSVNRGIGIPTLEEPGRFESARNLQRQDFCDLHHSLGVAKRVCCLRVRNSSNCLRWVFLNYHTASISRVVEIELRQVSKIAFPGRHMCLFQCGVVDVHAIICGTSVACNSEISLAYFFIPRNHGDIFVSRVHGNEWLQVRHSFIYCAKVDDIHPQSCLSTN